MKFEEFLELKEGDSIEVVMPTKLPDWAYLSINYRFFTIKIKTTEVRKISADNNYRLEINTPKFVAVISLDWAKKIDTCDCSCPNLLAGHLSKCYYTRKINND